MHTGRFDCSSRAAGFVTNPRIIMRTLLQRLTVTSTLLLGVALAATPAASAQAYVTGERGAAITPFVQTTLVTPDYGTSNNLGYTAGLDYTHFIRSIVQPSLEFRFTNANGTNVNERTYAGGLKLQTAFHGIHPYGTLLIGHGNITFNHPNGGYYGDNSLVYSLGGGAEFNVTQQWKLRLDYTHQDWNTGVDTFTPTSIGVGIAYSLRIHAGGVR
jgi:opacity protein-like surface antigen